MPHHKTKRRQQRISVKTNIPGSASCSSACPSVSSLHSEELQRLRLLLSSRYAQALRTLVDTTARVRTTQPHSIVLTLPHFACQLSSQQKDDASVARKLIQSRIAAPVVSYNPAISDPLTGVPPVDVPSLLIAFEHEDVRDVINGGGDLTGSIQVTHWTAGCSQEITGATPFSSVLGEDIQDPIVPVPLVPSATAAPAATGLNADYVFELTDEDATTPMHNGVLTIIRYPISTLAVSNQGVTTENNGAFTTRFCTRLSITNGVGTEVGFRSVDVTLQYSLNNLASVGIGTDEDNQDERPSDDVELGDFGTFPVLVTFEGSDFFTAFPVTIDLEASQGQALTFVVFPTSSLSSFRFGLTTELDMVALETCVVWIDSAQSTDDTVLAASGPDPGEPQLLVVEDGFPTSAVDLLDCDGRDSGQPFINGAFAPGVDFCVLMFNPSAEFILPDETIVSFRCEVTMEFDGTGSRRRRGRGLQGATDLVPGQQFSLSTPVTTFVLAGSNEATIESCTAGCFFLFCWFRFMSCWISSVVGF